jgi:hypothetical protein
MLTTLLLIAAASTGIPSVDRVEPSTLAAYQPTELTITGTDFGPDCRVLIGAAGRLVPVRHELTGSGEILVRLTSGYGPNPPRRQLIVDCGRNRRSRPFTLEIARGGAREIETPRPREGEIDHRPTTPTGTPTITGLDPSIVPAAEALTLTVMGTGFGQGAEVEIFANSNAGTSHTPAYEMLRFPTEVASDTVLLVDLDRGFAPSPRLRRVAVINPDGATSPPVYLSIQRRMP